MLVRLKMRPNTLFRALVLQTEALGQLRECKVLSLLRMRVACMARPLVCLQMVCMALSLLRMRVACMALPLLCIQMFCMPL
jgi:hypothetical protein